MPQILASCTEAKPEDVSACKHLAKWCLRGDPAQRPTIAEILSHRFLDPSAPPPDDARTPPTTHFFLSHYQAMACVYAGISDSMSDSISGSMF